jgi:hypothetical protein
MTDPDYFASSRFASLNNPMSESWVIRVYFGMPAACPFGGYLGTAGCPVWRVAAPCWFGLTPITRARLSAGGYRPSPHSGKFDGLLK